MSDGTSLLAKENSFKLTASTLCDCERSDPEARETMLRFASDCEKLAMLYKLDRMTNPGGTPMPNLYGSSEHWHECAQDARVMAEHMTDPDAQRAMRDIAANYDKIAKLAETREVGGHFPPRETD